MKLEFCEDPDCDECPLIRLYEFTATEVRALHELTQSLAAGRVSEVALHTLTWVRPIDECPLTMKVGPINRGVRTPKPGTPFEMVYTANGWLQIADKIAPFMDGSGGYQWLTEEGEVNVLLSKDGSW